MARRSASARPILGLRFSSPKAVVVSFTAARRQRRLAAQRRNIADLAAVVTIRYQTLRGRARFVTAISTI